MRQLHHKVLASLSLMALLALPEANLAAQQETDAMASQRRVPAMRVRIPPLLDGDLDEQIWRAAPSTSDFRQKDPVEGAEASVRTEVRFVYDAHSLYIGATMHVTDRQSIRSTLSRRDNEGNSERIKFSLDTYNDHRTAYTFSITASGVRSDYYHASDNEFDRDYSYDPVWEARVSICDTAWFAEIRIPFSQLRFNEAEELHFGLNMNRYIPSRNEDQYWVLIPKQETGWSSRFGSLERLHGVESGLRIEVVPHVLGDLTLHDAARSGNPFTSSAESGLSAGLDVKAGIGSNLTLDATINPDFGQVEADPAVVNLSAFETYFSERRPFFIEGSQLLQGNGPNYYYSRRIGAPPHGRPSADYADVPSSTTILGAGKITGRLPSGLSVGGLAAVTSREHAETAYGTDLVRGNELVEPLAGYSVLRLQQEFGESASAVGLMLTGLRRDHQTGTALDRQLTRTAISGGADWDLRVDGGYYVLAGHAGFSHIDGNAAAMRRVQESSAHYFQRPDAAHVRLDSSRTSMTGYSTALRFEKRGGEHWLYGVGGEVESPEFEINDMGRLHNADDIDGWGYLRYVENTPGAAHYRYKAGLSVGSGWDFAYTREYSTIGASFEWTWLNFWSTGLWVDYAARGMSTHLTRGGPMVGTGEGWNINVSQGNAYSSQVYWKVSCGYFQDELGSWMYDPSVSLRVRTGGQVEFSVTPTYRHEVSARQYIATLEGGRPETYGKRYIFSFIERTTFAAQLRLNLAFTPDLTLEMYAEPFVASGRYYRHGEVSAPAGRDLLTYGEYGTRIERTTDGGYVVHAGGDPFYLPNLDFNVLSFRSNLVLRWEWLPGSTLFLVWQQNRSDYEVTGSPVRGTQIFDAIGAPGDNYFAFKFTYWIPIS